MKTRPIHALAAASLVTAFGAHAQTPSAGDHASHHPAAASAAGIGAAATEGEVRKVDREQGKVTLRHGPIPSLEMPAMTMVFKAADPKLLDGLREGDKVRFSAERIDGAITLTAIEPAPR